VDVTELYERAREGFSRRLHALTEDQWNLPTPCTKWNVKELVHHVVYVQRWVPPLMAGETVAEVGDRFEGELLGDDPVATWEASIRETIDAITPEARSRQIQLLAYGTVTGLDLAYDMSMDLHVHTWDLSRAVGADEELDSDATKIIHDWLESVDVDRDLGFSLPRLRLKGFFAPRVMDVPADADTQTRMLAIVGRRSF
jgi:uncharacterized protein (TIGR03086 family)